MSKVKNFVNRNLSRMKTNFAYRQCGLKPTAMAERGDHLFEVLGVLVIAVILLVVFKDNITGWFNNMSEHTGENVEKLWEDE